MATDLSAELAIQSWCFRGFKSHEAVIDALKQCGCDRIELSAAHLKPAEAPDLAKVVELYRSAGITITCYGVFGIGKDEGSARKVFDFAKIAGFGTLSGDIAPGGLPLAEKLCAEYGVKLAIHNHGRKHRLGPVWALEELFAQASDNVGLCLDTAWMLDSGEDPVAIARKFADRLYGLHVKDFVFDCAGKPADVVVGQGNLDLPALLGLMKEIGFDGYFTLEYEGDVNDPVPATKQCVEAIRAAL